jgi:muconolactone delta-isomerase
MYILIKSTQKIKTIWKNTKIKNNSHYVNYSLFFYDKNNEKLKQTSLHTSRTNSSNHNPSNFMNNSIYKPTMIQ